METGAGITGVVVNRDGRPIAGATVHVEAEEFETHCECDEHGRFDLLAPPGHNLWVWSEPEGFAPGTACVLAPAEDVRIVVTPESVVRGRVVDRATGEPIASALVSVHRSGEVAGPAETTTDEDGRFRLCGLPPGRYEPFVFSEDWRGSAGSVAVGYRETSPELRIALRRCPFVRGRVLLPEPLERRGFVRLVAADGSRRTGSIQDDGSFEIRGADRGRWHLQIDASPFIEEAAREIHLDGDIEGVELRVRRGAQISGVVVDGEGRAIESASLALYHGGWGYAPSVQNGGTFLYEGIRPGRYRLTATACGAKRRASAGIDVVIDKQSVEQVRLVLASTGGATLRGRIVDPNGRPIERGHVSLLHFIYGDEYRGMSHDPHGSADGSFCFEGISAGRYTLVPERVGLGELLKPDGASARIDVELHGGDDVEIEIVVEGSDRRIEGRVVDAKAAPFPGVLVAVARESGDEEEYAEALSIARSVESIAVVTDDDGRFSADGLPRGKYTVVAYRVEGEEMIATGVDTDQRLTMMLDPPGTLVGRVHGETTFEICARRAPQLDRTERVVSPDGAFRVDGLSPGKWSVQIISARASAAFEAVVRPGRTEDAGAVELRPFGLVRGCVVDASGAPLARVEVVALSTHPRNVHAETDDLGRYELPIPEGWVHVDVPYGHHGSTRGEVRSGELTELAPIRLAGD